MVTRRDVRGMAFGVADDSRARRGHDAEGYVPWATPGDHQYQTRAKLARKAPPRAKTQVVFDGAFVRSI